MTEAPKTPRDFIRQIIDADNTNGRWGQKVVTRFPPEPNGYLHIGHAKSICLNSGLAKEFGGEFHLRFDDTNPVTEETEYVESIMGDVRWLGADWGPTVYWASDLFEQMYQWAVELIEQGVAYVDDQDGETISRQRGTLTQPGTPSPYRDRSVEENIDLFEQMRAGKFPNGAKVLRAKIDMAAKNMNLRDPIMYRIVHAPHHRTGDTWCIYPMYDWAHGLEDSVENITHSICTLEFEDHRPLYDWFLDRLGIHHPQQIEFARLNLTWTVMSKRRLLELVKGNHVRGWDDPRMPTIAGLRRRGYPSEAIRSFMADIGVTKTDTVIEHQLLEYHVRQVLNRTAQRRMAVLDPIKLVIENWPAGKVEELDAVNNPEDPSAGSRKIPFSGELYIEREDFLENPPPKFFRLSPGREVRLRWAYFVTCTGVDKDANGKITQIRCTYDPATRGGDSPDGRKVKATMHWVSAPHAVPAEVRVYDHLLTVPSLSAVPDGKNWLDFVSPNSLKVQEAQLEPSLVGLPPFTQVQFERLGYFAADADSTTKRPVFNRTVGLKDEWSKVKGKPA